MRLDPYGARGPGLQTMPPAPDPVAAAKGRLMLAPNDGQALYDLGLAYSSAGNHARSAAVLCQAVAADGRNAAYSLALGRSLLRVGRTLEAMCAFRQALAMDGSSADAYGGLGASQAASGEFDLAAGSFRKAAELEPSVWRRWTDLSNALAESHDYAGAYVAARKAHSLNGADRAVCVCLGEALLGQGRFDRAGDWVRRALSLDPCWADGHHNLARVLEAKNQRMRAISSYRKAIALRADHASAHFGLAMCLLATGNFREGWEEYEWRFKLEGWQRSVAASFVRELTEPMWAGEALEGKTLLLYAEQGFGDTIQMARYAVPLAHRGCRLVLMVYRDVVDLVRPMPSVWKVIAYGDLIPRYDFHAPLFSLPRILRTTVATVPCPVPYIRPPAERSTPLVIHRSPGLRVGFAWWTPPISATDHRTCPIEFLKPLFELKSITFYSLQVGADGIGEVLSAYRNVRSLQQFARSWSDTAIFISKMDLVITIDTGIAHLAGAMGVPVWLLLQHSADWRWLDSRRSARWRSESPWYPTARLFRAPSHGDWAGVVERVHAELAALAAAGQRTAPGRSQARVSRGSAP
jgi:tetratricopeptide (TPR) repeat protein